MVVDACLMEAQPLLALVDAGDIEASSGEAVPPP